MRPNRYVRIPDVITVHLGGKDTAAPNTALPFVDYLKGCAACLICPTWPEPAQRANIHAMTSFALHRVSSGHYRARGCDFDITGSALDDLPFDCRTCLFCNTSCLVEELFNNYLTRQGSGEPLLAKIALSGRPSDGGDALCQDGAVDMARRGYTVYDILRKYYGEDIAIVETAPRQGEWERFLGTPLMCGAAGENIRAIKRQLNRIAQNYPAIVPVNGGSPDFDPPCERAVRAFQYIFDLPVTGVLDKATWYSIKRTCAGIEQSDAALFAQESVPAMRPVLFGDEADPPQAAASPEDGQAAGEQMPGLVLPGRLISGSTPRRVVIPADDTLDSVISDEGIAERAGLRDAPTPGPQAGSAVENAARWNAARQSIPEGEPAPDGLVSGIITDRGIASRAEAANRIPGHPTPEGAAGDSVLRLVDTQPEGSAIDQVARWSAARQSILEGMPPPETIISDRGVAARAEVVGQIPGTRTAEGAAPEESPISDSDVRQAEGDVPGDNAVENAARWSATRQSILEGAADSASLDRGLDGSGITSGATLEQSPISDSDVREEEGASPEYNAVENAARWNASRQDRPADTAVAERSDLSPPSFENNHLIKIGPSVSAPLPEVGTVADSGHAVEWLRQTYGL